MQQVMLSVRLLDDACINPELIELLDIKYNASTDIADDLKKIFGSGGKDSSSGIYFVSLDRMNAILVMANSKRALGEFKRWVEKLDATTGRSIQTYIYTVENSTASNIMLILTALFGGEGSGAGTSQSGTGRYGTGGVGGGLGGYGGGMGGYGGGGGVVGRGSQLGPRLNQAPAMSSQVFRGGPLTGLQESVRIVANDVNNSLVIQASPADYAYLLDVIKK